jgi:hypothetical protein
MQWGCTAGGGINNLTGSESVKPLGSLRRLRLISVPEDYRCG